MLATANAGWGQLTVLPEEPVGEVIVATEIAKAGNLTASAVEQALALRAEGASWGLVAVAHGVRSMPATLAGLDAAVVPAVAAIVQTSSIPVVSIGAGAPTLSAPTPTPSITIPGAKPVEGVPSTPAVSVPEPEPEPVNGLQELVDGLGEPAARSPRRLIPDGPRVRS